MEQREELHILITSAPASDSWGFVGVVSVGDFEAYRTIRAYQTPAEALGAAQQTLAGVLGSLMAGQEWTLAQSEFGHVPQRAELEFGLQAKALRPHASKDQEPRAVSEPLT